MEIHWLKLIIVIPNFFSEASIIILKHIINDIFHTENRGAETNLKHSLHKIVNGQTVFRYINI